MSHVASLFFQAQLIEKRMERREKVELCWAFQRKLREPNFKGFDDEVDGQRSCCIKKSLAHTYPYHNPRYKI